jgi:hypothetical protein
MMIRLGTNVVTGDVVYLTLKARRQGMYVCGKNGTGKTTLLKQIAYQDMRAGDGLCVIDPHGDYAEELLELVPPARAMDVIYFAPGNRLQKKQPLGLNILACDRANENEVYRVTSTVMDMLYRLYSASWGARMEELLRNSLLTILATPDTTLLDLWLLLTSAEHREAYTSALRDPLLRHFWEVEFTLYKRQLGELVGSSINKIGRFLGHPVIRNIIAQPTSAFDMQQVMDEGKILIVNLSKGNLGQDNSALFGSVLVSLILTAALRRQEIPSSQRRPFHLQVDEYHNFVSQNFATLQEEARKYAIDTIVAHQHRDQLDDQNRGSSLNVGNFILLRTTGRDAFELATVFDNTPPAPEKKKEPKYTVHRHDEHGGAEYLPQVSASTGRTIYEEVTLPRRAYTDVQAERANQLANQPNHHAMCRLINEKGELTEHVVRIDEHVKDTDDTQVRPNPRGAADIKRASLELGVRRETVEAWIDSRFGKNLKFDHISEESEE